MVTNMKDKLKMVKDMEEESFITKMVKYMMGNEQMEKSMVLGSFTTQVEMSHTKDNEKTRRSMAKE